MAIIQPPSQQVHALRGVPLYHFNLSNCSQRVRIALAEKSIDWTSHHLDALKLEHLEPWCLEINPKGLVPALVQDGIVHVESNDIIRYLAAA